MKKLIGLVAMLLLGSGLVTVAAPAPARADCPYTNCIATRVVISGVATAIARRPTPYNYSIRVRPRYGDARPYGALGVRVRGPGIAFNRYYPRYGGGLVTYRIRFPRRGTVTISATFTGRGAWKDSTNFKNVQVVRR